MSTYHPFMEKYIIMLNEHKSGKLLLRKYVVFELLAAIKLKMLMWNDVKNIPAANIDDDYQKDDMGIDLINYDLNRAAQVKYAKGVTWTDVATFYGSCHFMDNLYHTTLVVRDCTKVVKYVEQRAKIIRLNYDDELANVPLSAPNVIINKFLHSVLFTEHRILELLEYFKTHDEVDTYTRFSDGKLISKFWYNIKYCRRLNKPRYSKLRECPVAMRLYPEETIKDHHLQVGSLLRFMDEYSIDDCNKLIIWKECKQQMKCSTPPWNKLMTNEELYEDYYQYAKSINKHTEMKNIRRLIKHASVPTLDHDFWIKCKTEKLCDTWPYVMLLTVERFFDSYYNFDLEHFRSVPQIREFSEDDIFNIP